MQKCPSIIILINILQKCPSEIVLSNCNKTPILLTGKYCDKEDHADCVARRIGVDIADSGGADREVGTGWPGLTDQVGGSGVVRCRRCSPVDVGAGVVGEDVDRVWNVGYNGWDGVGSCGKNSEI